MTSKIDSYYRIGWPHEANGTPCQDYARTLVIPDKKVFIGALSDGCSGSEGDPSVGARMLTNSFLQIVKGAIAAEIIDYVDVKDSLILDLKDLVELYDPEDFLATLLGIVKTPTSLLVHTFGDGCVVKHYKNGSISVQYTEFKYNAPYYLVYACFDEMQSRFDMRSDGSAVKYYHLVDADGNELDHKVTEISAYGQTLDLTEEMSQLHSVSLFSDGLQALTDESGQAISVVEAAKNFAHFAGPNGKFVTRRCTNRFVKKRSEFPQDDFSQVTLWLP